MARERLMAARLALGEAAVVVPEPERLVAEEPLREERWRMLALALYRSHRQADALDALRRARTCSPTSSGSTPGRRCVRSRRGARPVPVARRPPTPPRARRPPPAPGRLPAPARPAAGPRWSTGTAELVSCAPASARAGGVPRAASSRGRPGSARPACCTEARRRPAAGVHVLSARGSQLEKEFGLGAVRQLFDPTLADAAARSSC